MEKSKGYEVTDEVGNGIRIVRVTEGEFKDIEYRYGRVAFDLNEGCTLQFDYFIEKDEYNELADDDTKKRFHKKAGDILVDLLDSAVETGEGLVCAGGT